MQSPGRSQSRERALRFRAAMWTSSRPSERCSAVDMSRYLATLPTVRRSISWYRRRWMRSGKLDILVNNAGVTRDNLLMRMKDEEFEDVIRINLEAAFRLMRAASRPMMKARFGRIISITSVVGVTGNPGQANYVASKAALIGMTKSVAQELASRGITVNAVAPGFMTSAMTDALNEQQRAGEYCRAFLWDRWAAATISARPASTSRRGRPATSPDRRCTSTAAWRCSKTATQRVNSRLLRSLSSHLRHLYREQFNISAARAGPSEGL